MSSKPLTTQILAALSAFIHLAGCTHIQPESVDEFAGRLRSVIVENDRDAFVEIPCYPQSCIDSNNIMYVFGTSDEESFVRELLSRSDIMVKTFQSREHSVDASDRDYILLFYDPDLVRFGKDGTLSAKDRETLWETGYIETSVSFGDQGWGFKFTPFYYGRHLPFVEDYGGLSPHDGAHQNG